jgi:hypothetical protein
MADRFGLALLGLAATALLVPAIGALGCPDELDETRCLERCPLCSCCSHLPQARVEPTSERPGLDPGGSVSAQLVALPSPDPRDILHVPRPRRSS